MFFHHVCVCFVHHICFSPHFFSDVCVFLTREVPQVSTSGLPRGCEGSENELGISPELMV